MYLIKMVKSNSAKKSLYMHIQNYNILYFIIIIIFYSQSMRFTNDKIIQPTTELYNYY